MEFDDKAWERGIEKLYKQNKILKLSQEMHTRKVGMML